ncbi:MAG: TetR/AcrR family transcriptional regulator [Syntrophobacteraceae bacterium]
MKKPAGNKAPSRNPAGRPRSTDVDRAILDTALLHARKHGYASLTTDAIAAESGVGKPSIYRRWSSKAEIVTEALVRQAENDIPIPDSGSLKADLTTALQNVARQLRDIDGKIVRSLFAEAQLSDKYRPVFQAFIERRRRKVRDIVEAAVAREELEQGLDIDLVLDEIYGPILNRMLVGNAEIDERFVRAHLRHLFSGLGL